MARYIIRRLLWSFLLLILVSAVVFILFYVFPSADPAQLRAGRQANQDQIQAIRESLGLDQSVLDPVLDLHQGRVHAPRPSGHRRHGPFYFGHSYQSNADVKDVIISDLPATVMLVIGVGDHLARDRDPDRDHLRGQEPLAARPDDDDHHAWRSSRRRSSGSASSPSTCSPRTSGCSRSSPASAATPRPTTFIGKVGSMLLPWIVLAAATAAIYARYLRSQMIDVMGEDYIRTARAKGLPERQGDHDATPCAARSPRSSPCSGSTSRCCSPATRS